MKNPPDGYSPAGWRASAAEQSAPASKDYTLNEALRTWQWYELWAILFLNTTAGVSIISQASPMAQEITHVSATAAAGLVGLISIANGAGRLLWAWLSDFAGRRQVFMTMFLLQAAVFLLMSHVDSFTALAALSFVVLLCYGGGFGTMPALAADFFGLTNIGSIYGLMLTAWGSAAVVGPTLIAYLRDATKHYTQALDLIGVIMLVGASIPFFVSPARGGQPRPTSRSTQPAPLRPVTLPPSRRP